MIANTHVRPHEHKAESRTGCFTNSFQCFKGYSRSVRHIVSHVGKRFSFKFNRIWNLIPRQILGICTFPCEFNHPILNLTHEALYIANQFQEREEMVVNRGEIAVRVMRSCREMEITSIAIFSEADRTAKHVLYADEAYCVGPAASKESYLNIEKIIEVAKAAHADAIHPGYGFLSENATFARRCQEEGIIFIGPNPETMEAMGDKLLPVSK